MRPEPKYKVGQVLYLRDGGDGFYPLSITVAAIEWDQAWKQYRYYEDARGGVQQFFAPIESALRP